MEEKIKILIKTQKTLKGQLDQAISNFNKTGETRRTVGYLNGRIVLVEKYWKDFLDNHQKICSSETKAPEAGGKSSVQEYESSDLYETFEASFCEYLGELQDELRKKTASENITILPERKAEVKLPRIELPKFNGDYTKWRSFHDMFVSLIHEDSRIPMVQKLQYLKTSLSGEPEQILRQYDVTGSNYQAAWALLISRYDNKRALVSAQLKVLFNQSNIRQESEHGIKSLLDKTKECLHELESLGVSTKQWDAMILFLLTQRLPDETRNLWEQKISDSQELPKLESMYEFLESRFRTLEALNACKPGNVSINKQVKTQNKTLNYHISETNKCVACGKQHSLQQCNKFLQQNPVTRRKTLMKHHICFNCLQIHKGPCLATKQCSRCQGEHTLQKCNSFQQLSVEAKREFVNSKKLCVNCLKPHKTQACHFKNNCLKCDKRHHTWLHSDTKYYRKEPENKTVDEDQFTKASTSIACNYIRNRTQAILATAIVQIESTKGNVLSLRALIDLGSQSSFISEAAYQALQIKGQPAAVEITGLGTSRVATATKEIFFLLSSHVNREFKLPMRAYVIKRIANVRPPSRVDFSNWADIEKLPLADPDFTKIGKVDLLLGANIYAKILCDGLRREPKGNAVAQNTSLGWIIFGETSMFNEAQRNWHITANDEVFSAFATSSENSLDELNKQVKRFWESEELLPKRDLTCEEKICEEIYKNTHIRLSDGRYQVSLPFKNCSNPSLGDSKGLALKRFIHLEKKLKQNQELRFEYKKCMQEYITMGHMKLADKQTNAKERYYLPHHAVIKDSTTKVRVVFDASAKSSNGRCLNEQMLTGPTLQPKLYSTLMKWRKHKFAITADIEKMYRMILIHPNDRKYQTILWRDNETEPIQEYELQTVTFGTTAAPYLAVKTLQQLAIDEKNNFPKGSEIVTQDFYVDDVLTGADTIKEALKVQEELIKLLTAGGFRLRKWAANHEQLLEGIHPKEREIELPLNFNQNSQIKALGIQWHPSGDYFGFAFKLAEFEKEANTKRNILSQIAKLFDPLGWLAPSIILAKILMQKLWMTGCSWDQKLPDELIQEWTQFRNEISWINNIKIPRWIHTHYLQKGCQIHGFCDASMAAYAAVVYIRIVDSDNKIHITLLTAKTRVAPIKPITLPRLELCGATLLTNLINEVKVDMNLQNVESFSWTDSTIVLSWIKGHPRRWRTYVANRVSTIQEQCVNNTWNYVPTKENPADIASRGIMPIKLIEDKLWWNGPSWLSKNQENWPKRENTIHETNLEEKSSKVLVTTTTIEEFALLKRYSSFTRLVRVTAQCLRFINNCRKNNEKRIGFLQTAEINQAKICLLRKLQQYEFVEDYKKLRDCKNLDKNCRLLKLHPFMDEHNLIRVGGRLQNSALPYNTKHPVILPSTHHVTNLIIDQFHNKTLHGGAQLVLNTIRNEYWIINGLNTVKRQIYKCVKCTRFQKQAPYQLMGNLPTPRVNQARPFQNSGLDYAGPLELKTSKHRGAKIYKGYICIFVCMATKAIHIELVSDLTSEAFLAAFKRFISRRGLCSNVYSDNGTTFVGADRLLRESYQKAIKEANEYTAEKSAAMGITWHFIPPGAPHQGGIWEASVKSIKHHLRRVLGSAVLTFEELMTLLNQIEACLNSRPLYALSADVNDIEVLTPSHFLIGSSLLTPPEPIDKAEQKHIIHRWKYVQQLRQQFWKQWSRDYLTQLQQRQKWQSVQPNIRAGEIVIIKDEKLPPAKWLLGVVKEVYPGNDGKVRVVTVRTHSNTITRPVNKICRLPN